MLNKQFRLVRDKWRLTLAGFPFCWIKYSHKSIVRQTGNGNYTIPNGEVLCLAANFDLNVNACKTVFAIRRAHSQKPALFRRLVEMLSEAILGKKKSALQGAVCASSLSAKGLGL